MNWNLVGIIYRMSSIKLLISFRSVNKHGYHRNLVGSIYGMSSMKIAHFVRSVSKHGHHMQFLFLIGRFLKNLLLWNCLAIWTETLEEASTCMEGSELSFLKAEWKVSDTGSAHWTSSLTSNQQYFSSVPEENKFTNKQLRIGQRWHLDSSMEGCSLPQIKG